LKSGRSLTLRGVGALEERGQLVFHELGDDLFVGDLRDERLRLRVGSLADIDDAFRLIELVKLGVGSLREIILGIDKFPNLR